MKSRVFVSTAVAVLVCGMAFAAASDRVQIDSTKQVPGQLNVRTNGTFTSMTVTLQQTGPLQAQVGVAALTSGGSAVTSKEKVLIYGQIYDFPWAGGATTWTPPGSNTFVDGGLTVIPRVPDGGPFSRSWTFTVPVANTFQGWGIAYVGFSPGIPGYTGHPTYGVGFWFQDYISAAGPTTYVDATQPPTPTPSGAGEPVPALSGFGILAMIAILAGVAILVMYGRK